MEIARGFSWVERNFQMALEKQKSMKFEEMLPTGLEPTVKSTSTSFFSQHFGSCALIQKSTRQKVDFSKKRLFFHI
jgi:hypothetical protein